METVSEIFLVLGRIITILPLLLLITLFMGRRAIGELPVFDFLIIITLGAVVGADIADPNIKHLPTAIAIVAIGILQRLVSSWKIKNRKIGRFATFEPLIVVKDGKFIPKNLKKIRFSIDNILQMLREKGVFDLSEVDTAIVEANGAVSVFKKPAKHPVTNEDMNISKLHSSISYPLIIEGIVYPSVLDNLEIPRNWLSKELEKHGITGTENIFFASVNDQAELHISLKNESTGSSPTIHH
ncbi:DUF421 domain-containing protein [Bacillus sp. H-16]|uniref:DUF421 domain-containing protein n=1 Tax=Alteribacter salitolerans TaxID=2912333 RepID=UPI0019652BB2|nr:DUF421 domain-containing protein [Alteribacter salitolerans]MBM7095455.1 DUF421 domain-containing protein [Alteribacter salitolerans]